MNIRLEQSCVTVCHSNQIAAAFQTEKFIRIIKNSTTTLVLLSLGIALPWLTHKFGTGLAFLPIHLPLLIGSFLLPLGYALLLAIMIPLINTALIGMPVLFPALPIIVIELMVYILAIKYFHQVRRYSIFISLVISLLLGRVAVTIAALAFGAFKYNGVDSIVGYLGHLIYDFLPGLALQLLIVPVLALWFSSYFNHPRNKPSD